MLKRRIFRREGILGYVAVAILVFHAPDQQLRPNSQTGRDHDCQPSFYSRAATSLQSRRRRLAGFRWRIPGQPRFRPFWMFRQTLAGWALANITKASQW